MAENETSNGGRVILRPVLTDRCESPTDAVGASGIVIDPTFCLPLLSPDTMEQTVRDMEDDGEFIAMVEKELPDLRKHRGRRRFIFGGNRIGIWYQSARNVSETDYYYMCDESDQIGIKLYNWIATNRPELFCL